MRIVLNRNQLLLALAFWAASTSAAHAQTSSTTEAPPAAAQKPTPPPYSLPFQLRGAQAASIVRADGMFAFYENPDGDSGATVASTLTGSYKVTPELSPLLRLGFVSNSPPGAAPSGSALLNPLVGAIYGLKLPADLRLGLFLGLTVPVGSGGGNSPKPEVRAALAAGALARAAMDNALFAVNYFTIAPGVDLAYVSHGLTVQVEATLFQLLRVRGDRVDVDSSRTNSTSGLHVGYFLAPFLSVGAELRHQRWLSTPTNVKSNGALRDTTTVAVGPRFHFKLGETFWARPGIAYVRGLDKPMTDGAYNIFQLDLAFPF